ncbi:ribosome small subunit-dependent GTPase A [Inediibacterium massiliense]|uniref:ribosome small subunit-dependent GTPase A n=1 Tax=Inediibacterium massiliense TaxID=1658111 RepID=UPI0006B6343D|nr:ribosome small subunit-dependent GTPase A [Inediibacterium massiliense]
MIDGRIIKGIGGFYYVQSGKDVYECRARGKFRKEKIIPLVGDQVKIQVQENQKGVVEEILQRSTELIRPPVANIDQAMIVFAVKKPDPNLTLLDRFLVMAESREIDVVICFNKMDLSEEKCTNLKEIYSQAGYKVVATSVKENKGIDDVIETLKNRVTVFAGPSGVGKSSLLNSIQPNLSLQTGEISQKNKRGKHTTRHVELLPLDFGGWVLDTPGFSSLELDFSEEDLPFLFKEFNSLLGQCRFNGCKHINEPDCSVKDAVESGKISLSRYESYIQLLQEMSQKRRY